MYIKKKKCTSLCIRLLQIFLLSFIYNYTRVINKFWMIHPISSRTFPKIKKKKIKISRFCGWYTNQTMHFFLHELSGKSDPRGPQNKSISPEKSRYQSWYTQRRRQRCIRASPLLFSMLTRGRRLRKSY